MAAGGARYSWCFMTQELLKPLGGNAIFVLFLQLAVILLFARLGAEAARRIGLPSVVGELSAGLVLGPSGLGHFAPAVFLWLFPQVEKNFHLLEVVGSLGMVLLLLQTGLETDIRILKNLGRAALIASLLGMAVPFASGFVLGLIMPNEYLAHPDQRGLFSLFLATALSISAMPVIAKILMDLRLTKRNVGLVILSAGVVDDTAGWLILSVIAGAASHGTVQFGGLVTTLIFTGVFIVAAALFIYPLSRWLIATATRRFTTPDADLVFVLILAFACAATTEKIGIHAVFGAFVAGVILRQVPHLRADTTHRLESFASAVLAPVFFGIVGLKVNLWTLADANMLGLVLAVACFGKLVGCTLGSVWGGLRFWEGLSIAVAMNARGAMELVVAMVGLSLGILNQQMFSIIVVVAIATSFMAPLGLQLTMRKVRMTEDELKRMAAEESIGALDPERVRVLVPTGGGPHALAAFRFAAGIARMSAHAVDVVFVRAPKRLRDRFRNLLDNHAAIPPEADIELIVQKQLSLSGLPPALRKLEHRDVVNAVIEEAGKAADVLVLGASNRGNSLGGPILEEILELAPCHVVIIKAGPPVLPDKQSLPYKKLLVPYSGGVFSRVAVEFAARYAEATQGELTIALLDEAQADGGMKVEEGMDLGRISPVFRASAVKPTVLDVSGQGDQRMQGVLAGGEFDLVVVGAENRAIQHRLFFGYENERLINDARVAAAIVVPNLMRIRRDSTGASSSRLRTSAQ